jgi:trehalose 6-phosphate synthase/phosphatase
MSKLVVVSNRLPVNIQKKNGCFSYTQSVGGLATGLGSLSKKQKFIWVGSCDIPSDDLKKNEREEISNHLSENFGCVPVYLSKKEIRNYKDGFSNKCIWPIFLYFQNIAVFESEMWESYKKVNRLFADEVSKSLQDDDMLWVHDYHLMLVPQMVREKNPNIRIGFFLHIPFPTFEIFRLLPWRDALLEGLLGADLIGFHTMSYTRHFLSSVHFSLGVENNLGNIAWEGRSIKVDTFPMSIDYKKYSEGVNLIETQEEIKKLEENIGDQKVIISVDRLDYTKGLIHRLMAYQIFLERYPEYVNKVMLIMLIVPSRESVDEYSKLSSELEMHISRINGKYSSLHWTPIKYIYSSLSFYELEALYAVGDIALITPLRDGMNLVAKEYVASKANKQRGVLILSEMAGVSEEFGEAITVNPRDVEQVADALNEALTMPEDKQMQLLAKMQKRLKRNDVFKWAGEFVEKLSVSGQKDDEILNVIDSAEIEKISEVLENSKKRLLLLDYDGTLVPFKNKPEQASPDVDIINLLEKLIKNHQNKVCIVSGRDKDSLNEWFGHLNITLVAEHGIWIKEPGKLWRETILSISNDWKEEVRGIIDTYVDRTPKTFIEEKSYSLVWHYRNADPDLAAIRLKELKINLYPIISNQALVTMDGKKTLEIKRRDINKGKIVYDILVNEEPDFVMCVGDDVTDEDMFKVLKGISNSYSIKVGEGITSANYYVENYKSVRNLLSNLFGGESS